MLTKIFNEKEVHKLQTYIEKGDCFVIVTHLSPDGDALGSSLGLSHYLSNIGKEPVSVVVPNAFPSFLRWMPGAKYIIVHENEEERAYAEQLIREADVIFCLDFNDPKRIGRLAPFVEAADGRKIMIDHHLNPADFTKLTISYPEMSSTSEMIFRLICALKGYDDIDKSCAECIYTGMMTDTGAFTYNSNNPVLYSIITELVKKGVDKDDIYRKVFQVYSESRLRLMGYTIYEKMKLYPALKTALITLSIDEQQRFSYQKGDTEGFVNLPLSIEDIEFAVFLREDPELIKISFRSVGEFPCNEFASRYFQGGGHLNASGGEFYGTLEAAVAAFEQGLQQLNPLNYRK